MDIISLFDTLLTSVFDAEQSFLKIPRISANLNHQSSHQQMHLQRVSWEPYCLKWIRQYVILPGVTDDTPFIEMIPEH